MSRRLRLPAGATLVAAILLHIGVGVALAYWTGRASGVRSVTSATAAPVTLSPATPASRLYPGARADVVLTVRNSNRFSVRIPSLVLDTSRGEGGFAVDAAHPNCSLSALTFTTQANGGSGWAVPARSNDIDGSLGLTLNNALAMSESALTSCQGATFTVYLKVGP